MLNLGTCPAAKHLVLRSLLSGVLRRSAERRWKEMRRFDGRGRRVVVGSFAGHGGDGRPSDLALQAAAVRAASIRFLESHRPDPLLIDPYAGCFLSNGMAVEDETKVEYPMSGPSSSPCHYTLATKFIDDKLLSLVSGIDEVKQIVLLTDGFDTRPYRLKWPPRTFIFDISPENVFRVALQKLEYVGAEITKACKYVHIPLESYDLQASLCNDGFNGSGRSVWVIQGLPVMTLASFTEILSVVSSLAMKGCIFVGELPERLADTEMGSEVSAQKWMDKIFMSNGFRVEIIHYNEVAKKFHRSSPLGDYNNILFVAEQLQFSDKQVEDWRMEFLRMEEEGDEEGFEDLL
uniref:Putative S-adenosyl-L-methionine-dependent methyltransferase MSMEG_1480 n=1 Tax=Anthurium amnicola TaxID=1678845 RepID=A0A1D1XRX6_9ARAE